MGIVWRESVGRFADSSSGRFISESRVRTAVDAVADAASAHMAAASETLLRNEMSLATWQATLARELKSAHVAAAVLAHGGEASMTAARWGSIGPIVKSEYAYLAGFAQDIASGQQPLNRTVVSRAAMYGQAIRPHYEKARGAAAERLGNRSCRNVLHASESCSTCRSETARGWVEIGSLIPIGQRKCLSRCRCTISYRHEPAQEVAA